MAEAIVQIVPTLAVTENEAKSQVIFPEEKYRRKDEVVVWNELGKGNVIEVVTRRGGKGTNEEKQATRLVFSKGEREPLVKIRYERWDVDIGLTPDNFRMLLENTGRKLSGEEGETETDSMNISYHIDGNGPYRNRLIASSPRSFNRTGEYREVDLNIDDLPPVAAKTIFSKGRWDDLILGVYVRPERGKEAPSSRIAHGVAA